jgi:hypothetical protein
MEKLGKIMEEAEKHDIFGARIRETKWFQKQQIATALQRDVRGENFNCPG